MKEWISTHQKSTSEVVRDVPNLWSVGEPAIIGSFSWALLRSKRRLVMDGYAIYEWGRVLTPGDLARSYLMVKYAKKRRRVQHDQLEEILKHRHPPLYARPCRFEDAVYVDIKAAYWSIMSIVGWDVDYFPGEWIGVQSEMSDFPFAENKLARNILVTMGLPITRQLWTGSRLIEQNAYNPLLNHSIWAICQDVLNGLAVEMIRLGAVYVHTDGYILPARLEREAVSLIESWGLRGGVKARGAGWVAGVGSYKVGTAKTRRPVYGSFAHDEPLYAPHSDWLRERLRGFAEMIPRISVDNHGEIG